MKKLFLILFIILFGNNINANQVQIIEETLGNGLEVQNHSKVSVHYVGRLENNTEFDNSPARSRHRFRNLTGATALAESRGRHAFLNF